MKFPYTIAPLVTVGAAVFIALASPAPAALADSVPGQQSCTTTTAGDECQSPGNVQIDDSPPVDFTPQYLYWEGDSMDRMGRR